MIPKDIDCKFYNNGICRCICICSSECIELRDGTGYNRESSCEAKTPRKIKR